MVHIYQSCGWLAIYFLNSAQRIEPRLSATVGATPASQPRQRTQNIISLPGNKGIEKGKYKNHLSLVVRFTTQSCRGSHLICLWPPRAYLNAFTLPQFLHFLSDTKENPLKKEKGRIFFLVLK